MYARHLPILALGCVMVACGGQTPPSQLEEARASYERAVNGQAAQYAPDHLHVAQETLKKAEKEFDQDGVTSQLKSLAYVADREARFAEAKGEIAATNQRIEGMTRTMTDLRQQAIAQAANKARNTQEQLESERADLTAELEGEREARKQAQDQADKALEKLAETNKLKFQKDERGSVLTLSGSVLFSFNESDLLPQARQRLQEVARALKQYDERTFIIEGHTDSVGSDSYNMTLSRARAQSVANFLEMQGIPSAQLKVRAMGESAPVEPNTSPANRANNRRVEIIVTPRQGGLTMQ